MGTDLRRLKSVEIDVEGMSITAGGGCQAVDLETPLQGRSSIPNPQKLVAKHEEPLTDGLPPRTRPLSRDGCCK